MVFKTFDRISYGLVMESEVPISTFDRVQRPLVVQGNLQADFQAEAIVAGDTDVAQNGSMESGSRGITCLGHPAPGFPVSPYERVATRCNRLSASQSWWRSRATSGVALT